MKLVLDASAAMSLAANYAPSPLDLADDVLVPDLYVAEVTNAIWKNHRFLGTDLAACESLLNEALNFPTVFVPSQALARSCLALASAAKHPAYDLFYIALASQENAALFSNDKALKRLAHRHGVQTI